MKLADCRPELLTTATILPDGIEKGEDENLYVPSSLILLFNLVQLAQCIDLLSKYYSAFNTLVSYLELNLRKITQYVSEIFLCLFFDNIIHSLGQFFSSTSIYLTPRLVLPAKADSKFRFELQCRQTCIVTIRTRYNIMP